jgi:predicted helicase
MNTTEKGTSFELKVYGLLKELLDTDRFFINGHYRLCHRKKYFSTARQSEICVDLSIEYSRAEGFVPNLFVLIECKDYSKSIPVDDIEEFYTKSEQITGANKKCIFITTANLQQAALNFASAKGIGVIRILDDDSMTWIIERTNKHLTTTQANGAYINVLNALINEYYVSTKNDTFGYYKNKGFLNIKDLLIQMLK